MLGLIEHTMVIEIVLLLVSKLWSIGKNPNMSSKLTAPRTVWGAVLRHRGLTAQEALRTNYPQSSAIKSNHGSKL